VSNPDDSPQLRLVWPKYKLQTPPLISLPDGYYVRLYRQGDQVHFYRLMHSVGWDDWNDEKLSYSLNRILPDGWFMVIHESSDEIVASAMALHNYKGYNPFWGELGWLVGAPNHAGHSLGMAVSACVVRRFMEAGYRLINLYTEDFRLAALKSYLKLGFVPLIEPDDKERWHGILEPLNWPMDVDTWADAIPE